MSDPIEVQPEDVERWFDEESDEPAATERRDPAEKYADSQLRVVRETKDYQLDYLQLALEPGRGIIDASPSYQRRLRWNNRKKALLIESFLLNIPVPPIFLYERNYNEYEVIDGRQRLQALQSFLENGFALVGLEYWSELNGSRFSALPTVLQKGLLRRSLPAVILLAETQKPSDDDLDVRHVLFDRLNTGGIKLNPQELRNALYPGRLNSLLLELARSPQFTAVWGIPRKEADEEERPSEQLLRNPLYAQMADAELVLRFFALKDAVVNNRSGSLKDLLDRYMKANRSLEEQAASSMRDDFLDCLEKLADVFLERPFILPTGRRSRPLYDALMIACSIVGVGEDYERVRSALAHSLAEDVDYDVLVGRGNTIQAVRDRVSLSRKILGAQDEE